MTLAEAIAEITHLEPLATPGPWNTESDWPRVMAPKGRQVVQVPGRLIEKNRGPATHDTLIIALLRNVIVPLLAEREAMRGALELIAHVDDKDTVRDRSRDLLHEAISIAEAALNLANQPLP